MANSHSASAIPQREDYRSTLERAAEIENDFYHLKAQEWACEPYEAAASILEAINPLRNAFLERRGIKNV